MKFFIPKSENMYCFYFVVGIAQGSKISPILCNLYLGHMEREIFPDVLCDKDSLLMRWMDDPLLLTYDLELAKRYLTTTLELDPAYNCEVSVEKCLVNFDIPAKMKMKELPECDCWIPWCGILINKVTLEVKYDYSKTQGMFFCRYIILKYT
jgi:telomerase reverse transcriptase